MYGVVVTAEFIMNFVQLDRRKCKTECYRHCVVTAYWVFIRAVPDLFSSNPAGAGFPNWL